jgi:photosystem II stability/assembly factor-like uncharacterized protein
MSIIFPGLESYQESGFSFKGVGGYGESDTESLCDEDLIDKFDVTDSIQVMVDVAKFNRKLGIIKDDTNDTVINSMFNPKKDAFPVDKINLTVDEFAADVTRDHIISVGKFETLYSDFSQYVRAYFNHIGTASLFNNHVVDEVFDNAALIEVLSGKHNCHEAGVYVTNIDGAISLSNVNNLLRMACYTNAFNNRDINLNSDGFIAGDLIYIPRGIRFKLNVDVGFSASHAHSKGILHQLQTAMNESNADTKVSLTPSHVSKVTVAPLLIRLSNFPEETAGNYAMPKADINTGEFKWINRGYSYGSRKWTSIAMSSTGMNQLVGEYDGYLYRSGDYGTTWEQCIGLQRMWSQLSVSDTGQYQSACTCESFIYISNDYGNVWTNVANARNWSSISISSTGKYQTATVMDGNIWTSSDYGETWKPTNYTNRWKSVVVSFTGQRQTAAIYGGLIYLSHDYGASWIPASVDKREWTSVAMSASGQRQTACVADGLVYVTADFGVTWTATSLERNRWICVAMCGTGQYQSIVARKDDIYMSKDWGETWTNSTRRMVTQTVIQTPAAAVQFGVKPSEVSKFDYSASVNTETAKAYIGIKSKSWSSVAISFGGNIQSSIAWDGSIYLSSLW